MSNDKELTRQQLTTIAQELNAVLGLKPPIPFDQEEEKLKEELMEAVTLLVPDDDYLPEDWEPEEGKEKEPLPGVTFETQKLIAQLQKEQEEEKEKPKEKKKEVPLVNLIKATSKLTDLKKIVMESNAFASLRDKLEEFSGSGGPTKLKEAMLEIVGAAKNEKKKKKAPAKSKPKKDRQPTDFSKSNKAIVYTAWKGGEKDVTTLHKLVEGQVKETTIKGWLSMWGKGKGLPAIAKKK